MGLGYRVCTRHASTRSSASNPSIWSLGFTEEIQCEASTFHDPILPGAKFLIIESNLVRNYSGTVPSGFAGNNGAVHVIDSSFCNVSVIYTHPGQGDKISVQIWLPLEWNGRMMSVGGGGSVAGLNYLSFMEMSWAISQGYAALSSDAGLPHDDDMEQWAEISPGNPNLYFLNNLASVSLNDAAIIGKSIVADFYEEGPKYSYWYGCSQGGRQGMMLAQRYPEAYDGIAAAAPAIFWNEMLVGAYFPSLIMDILNEQPDPCEIDYIISAATSACDILDGVEDGVITDPSLCLFDPLSLVGTVIKCSGSGGATEISKGAANVIAAAWSGAQAADNSSLWYGLSRDSAITRFLSSQALETGRSPNEVSTLSSFSLLDKWIKYFVLRNSSADLSTLTRSEYDRIFHDSVQQYTSIIGTADPDLRPFRDAGGKMLTYHGLADPLIPPGGSVKYYDAASAVDADIADYYRLFLAPGVGHCWGGPGAYPDEAFGALVTWVEDGIAPDILNATTPENIGMPILKRPLCLYPKKQFYDGIGDPSDMTSFYCA